MSDVEQSKTPRVDECLDGNEHGNAIEFLARELEEELNKALDALIAASAALGPMENLINPDLRALKAQIEENL